MTILDSLINTIKDWTSLSTGSGFWNPLIWVIAIIVAFLLIYVIRSLGKKEYKDKTGQTQSFLSGNPEYKKEQMHIKGSNVYWGFTESLKWVYSFLRRMHNGNASDYVLWFIVVMSILLIVVGVI